MAEPGQIISLEQLIQQVNNIVLNLGQIIDSLNTGAFSLNLLEIIQGDVSVGTNLTNGSETTCYTATEAVTIDLISVAASTGTVGVATIEWNDGTTDHVLVFQGPVYANQPLVWDRPVNLPVGGTIDVTGANLQHVIVTPRKRSL